MAPPARQAHPVRTIDPMDHQGLVYAIALRHQGRGLELDDLVQEGQLGLLRACDLFDPGRNIRFATYATHWIRRAILCGLKERGSLIRVPSHVYRHFAHPGSPTITPGQRKLIAAAKVALGIGRSEHGSDGFPLDRLSDHRDPDPGPDEDDLDFARDVGPLLDGLPDRHRRVLVLRFGLDGRGVRTLSQASRVFGLSRERVRQIEAEAIGSLRASLQ